MVRPREVNVARNIWGGFSGWRPPGRVFFVSVGCSIFCFGKKDSPNSLANLFKLEKLPITGV